MRCSLTLLARHKDPKQLHHSHMIQTTAVIVMFIHTQYSILSILKHAIYVKWFSVYWPHREQFHRHIIWLLNCSWYSRKRCTHSQLPITVHLCDAQPRWFVMNYQWPYGIWCQYSYNNGAWSGNGNFFLTIPIHCDCALLMHIFRRMASNFTKQMHNDLN